MNENTRSPSSKRPTIKLPPGPFTVNHEAQDAKDDSAYQVLWSKKMDEGKYKSSSTYTNVEVLLLCWSDSSDDLAVSEEILKLKHTFETRFNYNAQISYLDAKIERKLQVQVNTIVAAFVGAHDAPTTLLIVYYAGHGKPGSYFGSLELHGQTSENDLYKRPDMLVWNKTEKLLDDAESDVLEIFDCCYAGNLGLTRGEHRLFEYLAATKEMAKTPVPGNKSFTSALIYALEKLVDEKGRFTTVELLKKIETYPDFPKDQTPLLSDRKENVQAGRIMLHPLHKFQEEGAPSALSSDENTNLDAFKRWIVTLHFDFCDQPSLGNIDVLGSQFNKIFERHNLGVNQIRWGGMQRSLAARAIRNFQAAGLTRSRRASVQKEQAALAMDAAELWLTGKHPDLLTPSSSSQHSPQATDFATTGSIEVKFPDVGATSLNGESDER